MRARARGFLLFSFAFSSVLSSADVLVSSTNINARTTLETSSVRPANKKSEEGGGQNEGIRTPDTIHGMDKRSAEFFPQTYGEEDKKKEPNELSGDLNFALDGEEVEKRARMGFTGMRGKKEYDSRLCAKIPNPNSEFGPYVNKRVFRNFNGLFGGKRAPLAFHGMRGKKSEDYENEIIDSEPFDYKDSMPSQEFLIESGLLDDEDKKSEYESLEERPFSKRVPFAFQGMRGKKEGSYDLKRAMGFLGMRGKKVAEYWEPNLNYKRVPTSFFGMKGKKAQSSGFFGMRGKKASPSAFFGIKGKREPLVYDLQDVSSVNQVKDSDSSKNRFRRGISWLNNSKKARDAFFGIRGKKSTWDRSQQNLSQFE